jgi:hypothetical protein
MRLPGDCGKTCGEMDDASLTNPSLDWPDLDIAAFRVSIRAQPLAPYHFLEILPKPTSEAAKLDGERLLSEGWTLPDDAIPSLTAPLRWTGHSRSLEFHLHAWAPVQRLLVAFDLTGETKFFDTAAALAKDWIDQCGIDLTVLTLGEAAEKALGAAHTNWWYDMAVAQRLQRLVYIIDVLSRGGEPDRSLKRLIRAAILHHTVLASETIFKAKTNHGYFQALNHYAAAVRMPRLDPHGAWLALARERLIGMIARQFSPSGVHLEHSPGYHYMVTVSLLNARRSGVLEPSLKDRVAVLERNLSWMIMPSGGLATIGDTDPRNLKLDRDDGFFEDLSLIAAITHASGVLEGVVWGADHGMAFARLTSAAGPVNPSRPSHIAYLAQTAAFHSRTHKHADHLSFVWYDAGVEILTDPARYGYAGSTVPGSDLALDGFYYADPRRVYVETTRAHNCVVIDGRNYARRGVKPFGSALRDAREENGMAVTESELWHFGAVRHRRNLVMRPGHFLLVLDWLHDRSGEPHDYVQHFKLAPSWQATVDGDLVRARHPGGTDAAGKTLHPQPLCVASALPGAEWLPIARGEDEPQLLGWVSDRAYSLTPASVLRAGARVSGPHSFATLFVLSDDLEIDRERSRANPTAKNGQIFWRDGHGSFALRFAPDAANGSIRFTREQTDFEPELG